MEGPSTQQHKLDESLASVPLSGPKEEAASTPDPKPESRLTGMSGSAQILLALTPMVSVALTAITFFATFTAAQRQERSDELSKEDTEWRAALEKGGTDKQANIWTAFEMDSFFSNARYQTEARSIAAYLLANLPGKESFDVVYFDMLERTTAENEVDLLTISRAITEDLINRYAEATRQVSSPNLIHDPKFKAFVENPITVYSDRSQSAELQSALVKTWQLDSATSGLSMLWRTAISRPQTGPSGGQLDLSGIVFLNNDFKGVDFVHAHMENSAFFGGCKVDMHMLPAAALNGCLNQARN